MSDIWQNLSPIIQDLSILILLIFPGSFLGLIVLRGYRLRDFIKALLWRYRWTNFLFVLLMATSIGLGVALIAQERGLRTGMARVADKFDLVIASPGSRIDMLLATVFLQPSDAPLLDGKIMKEVSEDPQVSLAAPIAYGDSYIDYPVVGSTVDFINYLAGGLQKGRYFKRIEEAVVGAGVQLEIGDTFTPAHGHGLQIETEHDGEEHGSDDDHPDHDSHDLKITVVGKMPTTGSPWDKSIIVAVESVWHVHGLGTGHAAEEHSLGPPFDEKLFPGTPAIIVRANKLWANYALASKYTRKDSMAFFPGSILARLNGLLGNVRQVMSLMATLSQVLVAAGFLSGLTVLARLFSRRFALLRALEAPRKFVLAIMWGYTSSLVIASALLGVILGYCAVIIISKIVTEQTDILVQAWLSWPEFHLVASYFSLTVSLALIPALIAFLRSPVKDLRSS